MYVALVPNRNSPPAYLLREGYREDGKVKSRTLANLSHWPLAKIERLRRVLRDEVLGGAAEGLTMLRSLPYGHVAVVLGIARKIGLDRLLAAGQAPARLAALVLAMILARVIDPASKLATARQLDAATATSSLGPLLELVPLHSDFDRLTVPWFQCGQVGTINQDSDTPGQPRPP